MIVREVAMPQYEIECDCGTTVRVGTISAVAIGKHKMKWTVAFECHGCHRSKMYQGPNRYETQLTSDSQLIDLNLTQQIAACFVSSVMKDASQRKGSTNEVHKVD